MKFAAKINFIFALRIATATKLVTSLATVLDANDSAVFKKDDIAACAAFKIAFEAKISEIDLAFTSDCHATLAVHVAKSANLTAKFAKCENFEKIIADDLKKIKENNLTALNNDIRIYGEIWPRFIKDLIDVGCGYWARLYQDIFKNRFAIDVKELERRLNRYDSGMGGDQHHSQRHAEP